jgi:hypothetical protein
MLGALAWQATVIKMIFLCPGEEIARGLIFIWPRVLLPHGAPVHVASRSPTEIWNVINRTRICRTGLWN